MDILYHNMLIENFDNFLNEGFFGSRLDYKMYWIDFSRELSSKLNLKVKTDAVTIDRFRRDITFMVNGKLSMCITHDWQNLGTVDKPVTTIKIGSDKTIELGKYLVLDEAKEYADNIYQEIKNNSSIQELKTNESYTSEFKNFSLISSKFIE